MDNKTSLQIFKQSKVMSQSDLGRLLSVNRSTTHRHVSSMDLNADGKIIIHSKNTLIAISEIMDSKINDFQWNSDTPESQEFLKLYNAVREEFKEIMWGKR